MNLLAVLEQNPEKQWDDLIHSVVVGTDINPDLRPLHDVDDVSTVMPVECNGPVDELSSFTL